MILNWLVYHLYFKRKIVLKSKIIDRLAYYQTCQISFKRSCINKLIFSWVQSYPYQCGFRKNHNAQYLLLKMIETWKKHLNKRGKIGVILVDLSKAFDTINHSFLVAKLDAYGFSRTSLKLTQNYLCNRQQRISINGSFSDWTEIITGVP